MPSPIVVAAAHAARLDNCPISSEWILAGTPEARSTLLAKSQDGTSQVMAWECTAGEFL